MIKYVFFQRRRLPPHLRITLDPPGLDPSNVDHVISESEDLQYQELEFISLTLVLPFAIAQPLQTCLIMPVQARHPPLPIFTAVPKCAKPLSLNQPINS